MRDESRTARLRALASQARAVKARAAGLRAQVLAPGGDTHTEAIREDLRLLHEELSSVQTAFEREQKQELEQTQQTQQTLRA